MVVHNLLVTLVPIDPTMSSGLLGYCVHTLQRHTCRRNTNTHDLQKKKKNKTVQVWNELPLQNSQPSPHLLSRLTLTFAHRLLNWNTDTLPFLLYNTDSGFLDHYLAKHRYWHAGRTAGKRPEKDCFQWEDSDRLLSSGICRDLLVKIWQVSWSESHLLLPVHTGLLHPQLCPDRSCL